MHYRLHNLIDSAIYSLFIVRITLCFFDPAVVIRSLLAASSDPGSFYLPTQKQFFRYAQNVDQYDKAKLYLQKNKTLFLIL